MPITDVRLRKGLKCGQLIDVMKSEAFSVYEAARELSCSSQWIRVLLAEQRLDGARKVDGQWQIPASALESFRHRREAVSA